jgi:hypothetical protein
LVQFPAIFDYSYFSKIPVISLSLIWRIFYVDFFRALSTAALLNEDNVTHWLCFARGFTDWSHKIAFDQLKFFCPTDFFRNSIASSIVHLLYFYADFLLDPFQATPLRSPDHSLVAAYKELTAHSRPVGTLRTTSSVPAVHAASYTEPRTSLPSTGESSVPAASYTELRTPLPSTGDSTVSSSPDISLQPDFVSFRDSVQSSLDQMQTQLETVRTMTHHLESNVQIGLNTRFGTMSVRLMEFQMDIEKKLETEFAQFRDELLGFRQTLRHEFNSLRARSSMSSGNIPPASAPSYRSTSNLGDFRDFPSSFPDNFTSRHSSSMSVRSTDSRPDHSPSVATVLLGPSPPLDSSARVALDLSLIKFEPKGTIIDVESCQQFLRDFHRYKDQG